MRGGGEAAVRGGEGGMWEQERKEWEETEAEEERDRAAQCCHCSPDLLSAPPSSSLACLPSLLVIFLSIEGRV